LEAYSSINIVQHLGMRPLTKPLRSTQPGHPFLGKHSEYRQKLGCKHAQLHAVQCSLIISYPLSDSVGLLFYVLEVYFSQ